MNIKFIYVYGISSIVFNPLFEFNIIIYRHERPSDPDDPLSEQNIRDRYYGNNDPVADKLMKRAKEMPALEPPEDPLITTLYVAGLLDDHSKSVIDPVSETDLRNHFYQVKYLTVR